MLLFLTLNIYLFAGLNKSVNFEHFVSRLREKFFLLVRNYDHNSSRPFVKTYLKIFQHSPVDFIVNFEQIYHVGSLLFLV